MVSRWIKIGSSQTTDKEGMIGRSCGIRLAWHYQSNPMGLGNPQCAAGMTIPYLLVWDTDQMVRPTAYQSHFCLLKRGIVIVIVFTIQFHSIRHSKHAQSGTPGYFSRSW